MSSPAPSRPPPAPSNPNFRRSFTLPAKIANRPQPPPASAGSADGIETLFTHTSTKIVSFTATSPSREASSSRRESAHVDLDTPGSIPWRSYTERTLAVGVLRIYRVTSSNVSFLNSGNLLHTIFPKSQCWCVDGESKFVLRIRQDSYYRIELPYDSDEDRQKVGDIKAVFDQVLQYEKTRCPFTRGFEVELPERPKTPPRRRPKKSPKKAKKWLFDKTWVPEDGPRPSTPVLEGSDSGTTSSYEEDDRSSINTDMNESILESPLTVNEVTPPKPATPPSIMERAKPFQGSRSVTTPSVLSMASLTISQTPKVENLREKESRSPSPETEDVAKEPAKTLSLVPSVESFYSLQTSTQDSPSPPYMDAEAELVNPWSDERSSEKDQDEERGRGRHRRQVSELTIRAQSEEHAKEPTPQTPTVDGHQTITPSIDIHPSSAPSTPPLISDSDEDSPEPPFLDVPTPPDTIRLKRLTGASQRRAFSPMPHPQNLFCPPNPSRGQQFTAALVRKTCELILGPPAHLVSLMLSIAAKVSNGVFGFDTYHLRHTGERIPCSWESSDEGEWDEDDYGIPLGNLEGSTLRRREFSRDID